jgi:hypothetical protein
MTDLSAPSYNDLLSHFVVDIVAIRRKGSTMCVWSQQNCSAAYNGRTINRYCASVEPMTPAAST